jgi:uncharacterized lipoprotein YddW (UPF0748 family)
MNRKLKSWFVYLIYLGLIIAVGIAPLHALSMRTPQSVTNSHAISASTEIRGVWLTNVSSAVMYVPWGLNRALHQLAELNFNTIYP